MNEQQQLEHAIAALEAQRAVLGDVAVEAALAGLRQQLIALQSSPAPPQAEATEGKPADGQQAVGIGERKLVTIVFADIAGFTALAERLDAEAVRDLMNACFAQLVPLVEKYGGTVDKFVGDAIMALFGAPLTHENDAERALRAALEMMNALERFKARRPELASLGLHVGINSGHVVAGDIGAGDQHAYSVIGDAVNLAARLEGLSQPGEILVGPDTYRLAAALFEFEKLAPVPIKGKTEPVVVYRLLKARAVRGKARGIAGLDSPLVGRQAEFQAMQNALLRLEKGKGGVITLVGEAGLGKSRLVAELRKQVSKSAKWQPWHWVEGRCLSYGASIAYLPWLDALRNLLGVQPDAAPAAVRDVLHQHVQALCAPRYDEVFPYLAKLLSLSQEEETEAQLAGLGAQGLKLATFQATGILLGCAAQARPLVLVCEDLHWADPTSLELLEKLLPLANMAPLLFIAVMRPEREHGCWQIKQVAAQCEHHLDLQITPLAPDESATLVSNLLHVQALPLALCQRILQSAEGNPFYVEEIIRSLLDSGAVVYEPALGQWQATREVDEIVIPDTLQGVLAARIDRLQGETKRILQLASVIGRVFFYRVLAAIAGAVAQAERELDDHLLTLQQQEMIRERARTPELEYIFKHQLTQEAAYNGLLKQERRIFHRQVAEALERLFPDQLDEQQGLLAHHWERAEEASQAIPCLLRAGTLAAAVYANEEALSYFRRALKLLDKHSNELSSQQNNWRLEALSKLGQTLFGISELAEARECLQEAIVLGRKMGCPARELVRLYHWLCEVLWWQNCNADAARLAQEGLALLGADNESVEAALMNKHIASNHWVRGDATTWYEFTARNESFVQHLPYQEELRSIYTDIATWYTINNPPGKALEWLEQLKQHAAQHHDIRALGEVHRYTARQVLHPTGNLNGSIPHYQQAIAFFERIGDSNHTCECLEWMADTYIATGKLDQAKACIDKALAIARGTGQKLQHVLAEAWITTGLILACQNAFEQALAALQTSRSFSTDVSGQRYSQRISFLTSQVYLAQGKRAEALRELENCFTSTHLLDHLLYYPYFATRLLNSLEEAHADPASFQASCQRFQQSWGERSLPFVQCYLEPAAITEPDEAGFYTDFSSSLDPGWSWHDPMHDCAFHVRDGLEIHAPNGRGLLEINLSAPRLLRAAAGDWVVQAACEVVSQDKPATGGLVVWTDESNWMRLDRGKFGRREIVFLRRLDQREALVGRGCLSFENRVWLRLERHGEELHAFCSANGQQWFTVGHASFPVEGALQVGMYAIGDIDRTVYRGAYVEGAALRFTSFGLFAQLS